MGEIMEHRMVRGGGLDYCPSWPLFCLESVDQLVPLSSLSLPGVSLHFHHLFPLLSEPVPGGVTTMMASPTRRLTGGGCLTWRRRSTVRGSARTGSSAWWEEVGRMCHWRRLRAVNIRVTVSILVSETSISPVYMVICNQQNNNFVFLLFCFKTESE